jgi:hypothetical protein
MVDFLHEGQQAADLPLRETFARKPVQVIAGQVGDEPSLIPSVRHFARDEQFEIFGVHGASVKDVNLPIEDKAFQPIVMPLSNNENAENNTLGDGKHERLYRRRT